jgi:hypothetical protein
MSDALAGAAGATRRTGRVGQARRVFFLERRAVNDVRTLNPVGV